MTLRRTLDVLATTVERATSFPLSASCLVNRGEVLALVERARSQLPAELNEAAALLQAHEDVIAKAETQAQQVIAAAQARADDLVSDGALVATAQGRAAQILDAARDEAARLLREADDYCDRRLAAFEDDLARATAQIRRGRDRLRERSDLPAATAATAATAGAAAVAQPAPAAVPEQAEHRTLDVAALERQAGDDGDRPAEHGGTGARERGLGRAAAVK